MDDFLTKPLQRGDLLQTIGKWLLPNEVPGAGRQESEPGGQTAGEAGPPLEAEATARAEEPAIDFALAIKEFEGQRELLLSIVQEFSDEIKHQIEVINVALTQEDAETIRREAHSIKGGAANIHAHPLSRTAKTIEELAKAGALTEIPKAVIILAEENERMRSALREVTSS